MGISSFLWSFDILHDLHIILNSAFLLRLLHSQPTTNTGANGGSRIERGGSATSNRKQTGEQVVQGPERPEELRESVCYLSGTVRSRDLGEGDSLLPCLSQRVY